MKLKQFTLFILLYLLSSNFIIAQSDISMITHSFNRATYNPASIARPNYIYLFTSARSQWNGVSGGPMVVDIKRRSFFKAPILLLVFHL